MGNQLLKGVWWKPEGGRVGSVMQKYNLVPRAFSPIVWGKSHGDEVGRNMGKNSFPRPLLWSNFIYNFLFMF